ncbi:MAG: hypothetical protein SWH78_08435 [Thermodesulfobacteriota bacterium]|nr:hypothetical protein [Thermodesulfobacteriota bacterium]
MASIEIRDLEMDKELDKKAMTNLTGGCPWGYGGGVATIGSPSVTLANPFRPYTILGRYPTIPSWMWGMLQPA